MYTQKGSIPNWSVQVLFSNHPISKLVLIFFFFGHFKKGSEVLAQLESSATTFPKVFVLIVVATAGALVTFISLPFWLWGYAEDITDEEKSGQKCCRRLGKVSAFVGAVSASAGVVVEILFVTSAPKRSGGFGGGFALTVAAMVMLWILCCRCFCIILAACVLQEIREREKSASDYNPDTDTESDVTVF
jgi:hypothetical protein